jgi:nitrogen fixation protein FixH
MLSVLGAFFGTVIVVNLALAAFASRSWTGLVVENSYVASQEFNLRMREGRAQAELGWSGRLTIGDGHVRYRLVDARGQALRPSRVTVTFRRPVSEGEDRAVALLPARGGDFEADMILSEGSWIVEIQSEAGLDKPYRDFRRILVQNGASK